MSTRYYFGVDPGSSSGSICAINEKGAPVLTFPLKDQSDADIKEALNMIMDTGLPMFGALEQVHAMPKQGVSSTFKFGGSYGALRAHMVWADVHLDRVTPHRWQTALGCRTRGDKNVTKHKAQEMFPLTRVTHSIADGLLLAQYARQFGTWREGAV